MSFKRFEKKIERSLGGKLKISKEEVMMKNSA